MRSGGCCLEIELFGGRVRDFAHRVPVFFHLAVSGGC